LLDEGVANGGGNSDAFFPATCHPPVITAPAAMMLTPKICFLIGLILPFSDASFSRVSAVRLAVRNVNVSSRAVR